MKISADEVRHVARLSRLELDEAEVVRFCSDLGRILEYMDLLKENDTRDVEALSHPLKIFNVMRQDQPRPSQSLDEALENAPETEAAAIRVPAVLE